MSRLPVIIATVLLLNTAFQFLKSVMNTYFVFKSFIKNDAYYFFIFGDPFSPNLILMFLLTFVAIVTWLFSTRVKRYQSFIWRLVQFYLLIGTVISLFLWNVTAANYKYVIPYFLQRSEMIDLSTDALKEVLVGNTEAFLLLIMALPFIGIVLLGLYLIGLFNQYRDEIIDAFKNYEVTSRWLQRFTQSERNTGLPDIILGPDSQTNEQVTVPGKDRSLNMMIIGSIGTGKTAAIAAPMINQDLHHFTKYINDFPRIYQRDDFDKVKGDYLNGLVIIEPSNDLCQDVYRLCLAHGIPEEAIYYVDPTNDNTPAINPLQGPVDKVAESLTMVVEGLGENDNFFFAQSQRAHFKQYIYLLKLHSAEAEEPTMADLYTMYNDVQLVHLMHEKLKQRIEKEAPLANTEKEKDFWSVVQDVDRWFDDTIVPVRDHRTNEVQRIQSGKYKNKVEYYDKKGEFIEGLRNILTDISSNVLLRKVLFRKSSFDFDAHLKAGGILLVNTEKGDLMELSNVLGKMVLLSVQNAVFRRQPKVEPYHSIYADEFADYIYKPFKSFPAQSRKYKANIHVIAQTIAQLADDFGPNFMHTLLTTFRHKVVYSDVSQMDAETFSFLFHEKNNYVESSTEQSVSPLQDSPVTRMGMSYQQEKDAVMSPGDILSLKAFEAAAKIVVNNESKPARRIKANFVPYEEFTEAKIKVNPEAAAIWLSEREKILNEEKGSIGVIDKIETVNEQEQRIIDEAELLDVTEEEVAKTLKEPHDKQPQNSVRYQAPPPARLRKRIDSGINDDEKENENDDDYLSENLVRHPGKRSETKEVKTTNSLSETEPASEKEHENIVKVTNVFEEKAVSLKVDDEVLDTEALPSHKKAFEKSIPSQKEKAMFDDLVESIDE